VNTTLTGTFVDPIPPGTWTVHGVQMVVATSICGKVGFTGAPVVASMGSYNLSTYSDIPVCTCNPPQVQFSANGIAYNYAFGTTNTISSKVVSGDTKTAFCMGTTGVVTIAYDVTPPVRTTGRATTGSSFIIATTGGVTSSSSTSAAVTMGQTTGTPTSAASSISASVLLIVAIVAVLTF